MSPLPRLFLLFAAALLIAGGAAYVMKSRIPQTAAKERAPEMQLKRILIAESDIPAGSFIRGGKPLAWSDWPEGALHNAYIQEGGQTIERFNGAVARQMIHAGEPVTEAMLAMPGDGGFLPAVLGEGMRAVTVAVTMTSGNAGFIFPGDKVDLLVTHEVRAAPSANEGEPQGRNRYVSETFIENIRVLAIDQIIQPENEKAVPAKTVTLEVTPKQAEKIQIAEGIGKISLSLRSLANEGVISVKKEQAGSTRDSEVSSLLSSRAVVVTRGGKTESIQFEVR